MITEEGLVTELGSTTTAWVATTKTDACKECSERNTCNAMGDSGKEIKVEAINLAGARVGDRIVLSFETASLLKAAFLLYVFPILCMLSGAIVGCNLAFLFNLNESSVSAVSALLFFILSVFFIKSKGNKLGKKKKYQPKIIRIIKYR